MRKMLALIALTVGMGTLAMSDVPFADAQEKKEAKKADPKKADPKKADPKKADPKEDAGGAPKKKEDATASAVGTIEIYKAKDGFRFRIKDADGKVAAMPVKGVETLDEAQKDLEFIKATLNKVKPTVIKD